MGLGISIGDILDPAGVFTGKEGVEAAEKAASITDFELNRQFDVTQENLRPALDAAQRTLPGIQQQLDPSMFGGNMDALSAELSRFLQPTQRKSGQVGMDQLQMAGLSPGAGVRGELESIDPSVFADLLFGAESDLFNNRMSLAGLGQGAGGTLSELGQRTGAGIAQSNTDAANQAMQAQAAGKQNAVAGLGMLAAFASDESLKEDIQELGEYKGLRIIKWKWREWVPESWRGMEFGFSAQDILSKHPEFVKEFDGFLTIDRDGLMNKLEVV